MEEFIKANADGKSHEISSADFFRIEDFYISLLKICGAINKENKVENCSKYRFAII